MSTITIIKGLNEPVKQGFNFTHAELHPNSASNMTNQSALPDHLKMDESTINILQTIRNYYGVPLDINATARTAAYQSTVSSAKKSEHVVDSNGYFTAVDWDFSNNSNDYRNDFKKHVLNKTEFFESLVDLGLSGVGLYDTFIHIDAGDRRSDKTKGYNVNGKKYSFWDYRESKPELNYLQHFTGNVSAFVDIVTGHNTAEGSDERIDDFKGSLKKKYKEWILILVGIFALWKLIK